MFGGVGWDLILNTSVELYVTKKKFTVYCLCPSALFFETVREKTKKDFEHGHCHETMSSTKRRLRIDLQTICSQCIVIRDSIISCLVYHDLERSNEFLL